MQEHQKLKALLALPKALKPELSPEKIQQLKKAFQAELISCLGGEDYLKEKHLQIMVNDDWC